ncbi:beta-propeller domain-containing protein [Actinocorallia sp. API 0066]|uniref:beta-propeller domain-containing protein n=1 Tax=Actinocorallia sp. API 0066 TaxID=2896846 RepID=UPI001E46D4FB|nr:beta-propeller domain-containing protein [Actinocorallia sp. API 0066]MCD0448362.1 beta-propeller domain-containing protein [Actinocorallia sp. API 0066]
MRHALPLASLLLVPVLLATACTGASAPPPADLSNIRLVAYDGCDALLDSLRAAALKRVDASGLVTADDHLAYRAEGGGLFERNTAQDAGGAPAAASAAPPAHSTTNTHTAGVDEPDEVKTDGGRVLLVADGALLILDGRTGATVGKVELPKGFGRGSRLLLHGDTALVLGGGFGGPMPMPTDAASDVLLPYPGHGGLRAVQVDLKTRETVAELELPGGLVDARQVGSAVRLVVRSTPRIDIPHPTEEDYEDWKKSEPRLIARNKEIVRRAPLESFLPAYKVTGADGSSAEHSVPCERISHPADDEDGIAMVSVFAFDLAKPLGKAETTSVVGGGETVYGTADSLYVTETRGFDPLPTRLSRPAPVRTRVHRFAFDGLTPRYTGSGEVVGQLLNQYSMSEHDGHLRVAVTDHTKEESSVHVLTTDGAELKKVGSLGGLGKGEQIYSVRFIGPRGYVVTFRQVDPLYTIDLADPKAPRALGELKITGYSAYLHPTAEGRLLGVGQEADLKGRRKGALISLFDVSGDQPARLSQLHLPDTYSTEVENDAHGFLYWPETGLTVLPAMESALVLTVTENAITQLGEIRHEKRHDMISRALYIDGTLWTVSYGGIRLSDAKTLKQRAWITLPGD